MVVQLWGHHKVMRRQRSGTRLRRMATTAPWTSHCNRCACSGTSVIGERFAPAQAHPVHEGGSRRTPAQTLRLPRSRTSLAQASAFGSGAPTAAFHFAAAAARSASVAMHQRCRPFYRTSRTSGRQYAPHLWGAQSGGAQLVVGCRAGRGLAPTAADGGGAGAQFGAALKSQPSGPRRPWPQTGRWSPCSRPDVPPWTCDRPPTSP